MAGGRSGPRFTHFAAAKAAYEDYLHQLGVDYADMSETHYARARQDQRLIDAERGFRLARGLSNETNELVDATIAEYQLALVYHAQGRFAEAEQLLRDALKIFDSIPGDDRPGFVADCHYHLGIIILKTGSPLKAAQHLLRSQEIDRINGNLAGVRAAEPALAACTEAEVVLAQVEPLPLGDGEAWTRAAGLGAFAAPPGAHATERAEKAPLTGEPISRGYNRREVVLLASHSVAANDAVMAHFEALANEIGRPIEVFQAAFGAQEPDRRRFEARTFDQHVCALVLIIEKQGLEDRDFLKAIDDGLQAAANHPDFQVFAYLNDMSVDELRGYLADQQNEMIEALFDRTQIAESPSLERLQRDLVPYLHRVEFLRAAARWRSLRLAIAERFGRVSRLAIRATACCAVLGIPLGLFGPHLAWLGRAGPLLGSLVLGILAFPMQAWIAFYLLRGSSNRALAANDGSGLRRWIGGLIALIGATQLYRVLNGSQEWLIFGFCVGIVLEVGRRAGKSAERQKLDIDDLRNSIAGPGYVLRFAEQLRSSDVDPTSCRLVPRADGEAFISYTRSSAIGSGIAGALYKAAIESNAATFLDTASIPVGSNWLTSLNGHLSKCDRFISILDRQSAQRTWVASELVVALEGRRLTGSPEITILLDPALCDPSLPKLAVLAEIAKFATEPPVKGRPQVIEYNDRTIEALAWLTRTRRVRQAAVLPYRRAFVFPYLALISFAGIVGAPAMLAGFVIGMGAVLEILAKMPFAATMQSWGCLTAVTLLVGFWLGCMGRDTVAYLYEQYRAGDAPLGLLAPALSRWLNVGGLLIALVVFAPHVSPPILAWALLLVAVGWLVVNQIVPSSEASGSA